MFDFGDELIIGSQRIPWLIWIQLLVMLLLIILLYYFTISASGLDPSPAAASFESSRHSQLSAAAAASIESSRHSQLSASAATASTSRLGNTKMDQSFDLLF